MKRLPTQIKQARGTLRKCRENPNEPEYVLLHEIPDPPPYLSEAGRKVYFTTAEELLKIGVLSRVSFTLFVMYCIEVDKYYQACKELSKAPMIIKNSMNEPRVNPWQRIANESLYNSIRLAGEFGLSPSTAGKVTATGFKEIDPKAEKLKKMAGL